jgi:glycerol kinase
MARYILAIDQGTTSTQAMDYDALRQRLKSDQYREAPEGYLPFTWRSRKSNARLIDSAVTSAL